jgi:hypothetical protein
MARNSSFDLVNTFAITTELLQDLESAIRNPIRIQCIAQIEHVFDRIISSVRSSCPFQPMFRLVEYELKSIYNSQESIDAGWPILVHTRERKNVYSLPYLFDSINLKQLRVENMDHATNYMLTFVNHENNQTYLFVVTVSAPKITSHDIQIPNCSTCTGFNCIKKGTMSNWCLSCYGDPRMSQQFVRQCAYKREPIMIPFRTLFERAKTDCSDFSIRIYKNILETPEFHFSKNQVSINEQCKMFETELFDLREKYSAAHKYKEEQQQKINLANTCLKEAQKSYGEKLTSSKQFITNVLMSKPSLSHLDLKTEQDILEALKSIANDDLQQQEEEQEESNDELQEAYSDDEFSRLMKEHAELKRKLEQTRKVLISKYNFKIN